MDHSFDIENDNALYRLAFGSMAGVTLSTAERLLERCGGEANFFTMKESELSALAGFSNRMFSDAFREDILERARRELEYAEAHNIRLLYFRDPSYPANLLDCEDAPLLMFSLGQCDVNNCQTLGIVGTRHATPYGVSFVKRLVEEIAANVTRPVAIVSGLAYGIDIAAHRAALDNGLPTIAVVAHGLNTIYPAVHRQSAADIVRHGGAIMTEYFTGMAPHRGNFLARNRIVAGLSEGLFVAESARKGGALVTARIAGTYGRSVFALPGRISDCYSEGCNLIIARNQASLVTDPMQIIEDLGWETKPDDNVQQSLFPQLTDDEIRVLTYLGDNPDMHISTMAVDLNIPHARLNAMLMEFEFKELILRKPGGLYALCKPIS